MSLIALLCLAAAPALPALTTPACELTQHTSTIHATKNNDVIEMVKVRGKRKPYPAFVPDDPGMCHHLLLYLLPPMFFLHSVSTAAWFW